jgi:predicted nucleic acid-binding protein
VHFFYLDASALAKRYAPEVGTPLVNHLIVNVALDRMYVFNVGIAEVVSILVRKRNGGHLSAAAFKQAIIEFGAEFVSSSKVRTVVADNALVTAALPFIELHSLNATDAIVLRSAVDLGSGLHIAGNDLVLVASDQRILRAARAEGLTTFDPETQTQTVLDSLITS